MSPDSSQSFTSAYRNPCLLHQILTFQLQTLSTTALMMSPGQRQVASHTAGWKRNGSASPRRNCCEKKRGLNPKRAYDKYHTELQRRYYKPRQQVTVRPPRNGAKSTKLLRVFVTEAVATTEAKRQIVRDRLLGGFEDTTEIQPATENRSTLPMNIVAWVCFHHSGCRAPS